MLQTRFKHLNNNPKTLIKYIITASTPLLSPFSAHSKETTPQIKKNNSTTPREGDWKRTWAPFFGTRFWFPDPWSCARLQGPRRGPAGAASRRRRASPTSSGAPASCVAFKRNDVVHACYPLFGKTLKLGTREREKNLR